MREIKFRAKAKFSGTIGSDKWLYSSLMRLDAPTHRLNLAGQDCELETLGQFTGLKDKNGKEIYEGDICKIWFDVSKVEDHIYNSLTKEEQETAERIFIVESPLFNNQQELNADQIEVIGNIHENKE